MTCREDDFDLGYREPGTMLIDLEQLSFASWNNQAVGFDIFDRYTLRASHSGWRPDLLFSLIPGNPEGQPPTCELDCASLNSGLTTRFTENVLEHAAGDAARRRGLQGQPERRVQDRHQHDVRALSEVRALVHLRDFGGRSVGT